MTMPAPERRRRRRERLAETAPERASDAAASPPTDPDPEPARGHRAHPARSSQASVRDTFRENSRLIAAIVLLVAGIVFVLLGWYGAANTNILTEQIPYLISGGLLGVALIIVAGFFASSMSLERENRELRRQMERAMEGMAAGGQPRLTVVSSSRNPSPSSVGGVIIVPGGRSYHQAGCPIVEGKDGTELALEEAVASGFAVCKLCGPD